MNKSKTPAEPDEMRMPADKFDEMMRRALGAPPPPCEPKKTNVEDRDPPKKPE